ncbi:hypothetical protein J4H86_14385 [Spiractinospora alimapuensis]|uniref:hypothetical protein n=1 Tax=Spiractinospora alimapuensis TaxID=2820884 RepID=UPI001F3F54BA|nr:hypothetical protein [Spiractinospora alimapuensis]QVQ50147.1 hypothetical protein J4H86_14385 [Spiractinospora alimapuensis]
METADPDQVLAPGRADLEKMRSDPSLWSELNYEEADGVEGYPVDGNGVRRAAVLWAAQYDRRPEDLDLLRHLLEQETINHQAAHLQGISDELRLAVYLVVRWIDSTDLKRIYEARFANFDTWFALSGIPLGDLSRPGREPVWDPAGIRRWVKEIGDVAFPKRIEEETEAEWARRARVQGMAAEAKAFLLRMLQTGPPDTGLLRFLQYELSRIGEFAEAAGVQRLLVARDNNRPYGTGSALCRLSELELRCGNLEDAWRSLRRCVASLENDEARKLGHRPWRQLGIARHVVAQHMEIVLASAEHYPGLAHEVVTSGAALLDELADAPPALLALACDAALSLSLRSMADRYDQRARGVSATEPAVVTPTSDDARG